MKLVEIKNKITKLRQQKKTLNIPPCWRKMHEEFTEEEKAEVDSFKKREDMIGYFLDKIEERL